GLGDNCIPAKDVKRLADVDEREVNHPEKRPREHRHDQSERFRPAGDSEDRQRDAAPDRRRDKALRAIDPKQARRTVKRDVAQKAPDRLQPALAQQRDELISRDQKRDQINAPQPALEAEPGQPEIGGEMHSRTPKHNLAQFSGERTRLACWFWRPRRNELRSFTTEITNAE